MTHQAPGVGQQARAETCLLLVCGLPGAGKTCLAQALAVEACRHGVEARHVCFDELGCQPCSGGSGGSGDATGGDDEAAFSPAAWQQARKAALEQLRIELSGGTPWLRSTGRSSSDGSDGAQRQQAAAPPPAERQQQQRQERHQHPHRLVIADDNLHYRSMRQQCHALARAAGAAAVLLHVHCSEAAAAARNAARPPGQRVPAVVVPRMAALFEAPGSSGDYRDAWERSCLVEWDGTRQHPSDAAAVAALWQQVSAAWGPPAPPPHDAAGAAAAKAAAQAATAASLAHAVDVASRQALSEYMQRLARAEPHRKAAASKQLNAARRQLLQELQAAGAGAAATAGGQDASAAAAARWAAAYRERCEALLGGLAL